MLSILGWPFPMSLQWWGRKEDFGSEARITKVYKYCPRAQSSCLRPSRIVFNPLLGLFCLSSSIYNTVAALLTAIEKCCETCLKKICKSRVHSFMANVITGLIKYKQIVFLLQIIPQGSHHFFFQRSVK